MGLAETVHDPDRGGDAPGRPVEVLGRVGLVAYGGVHVLLAALIVRVLIGGRRAGVAVDQGGVVTVVASLGVSGRVLLGVAATGLVAFGVWQACAAIGGFRWVSGGERTRKRWGAAAKAIAVLAVATATVPALVGDATADGNRAARAAVAVLIDLPGGRWIVAAVAAVAVAVAISMVYTGVRATFLGDLWKGRLSRAMTVVAVICGSAGNFGRGIAIGGVGWTFAEAALADDPARSTGLDGVLQALAQTSVGAVVLALVAAGVAAFGVYCGIDAYARRA
jgi:hypothetical protein